MVSMVAEARIDPPKPDNAVEPPPAATVVKKPTHVSMFAQILAAKALKPVPK